MPSTLQFQGEEAFDATRETLWRFLADIRNVPQFVPNLRDAQFPAPDTLTGKLASSFSFMHGKLDLTIQITERQEPSGSKMTVTARGVGNRAIITGSIELPEVAAGPTLLRWQAAVQLEGLLKAVSKGLIEGAARKIIAETFQAVRKKLVVA